MKDIERLQNVGYLTKEFTPYHFQFRKRKSHIIVNVWPTAKKILKQYEPGPAVYYTDILKAAEAQYQIDEPAKLPQVQQNALDLVYYFRENWQSLFAHPDELQEYLEVL